MSALDMLVNDNFGWSKQTLDKAASELASMRKVIEAVREWRISQGRFIYSSETDLMEAYDEYEKGLK